MLTLLNVEKDLLFCSYCCKLLRGKFLSVKRKSRTRSAKIANPVVGIEGIHHAIRALYAYKKPAIYKDLASAANLHPIYVSQALSSSRDVGLTKLAGKRGIYALTEHGEEYARLLSFGKDADCKDLLQKTIIQNPYWTEIVTFLRVSKGQARDPTDLVLDVEAKLGKRWSNAMRGKVGNAYASILSYAGLVKLEKGKMISTIGIAEVIQSKDEINPPIIEKTVGGQTGKLNTLNGLEGFAEFRLPDSFILYVRKDIDAIEFFEKQVKYESVFSPWIQFLKNKVGQEAN